MRYAASRRRGGFVFWSGCALVLGLGCKPKGHDEAQLKEAVGPATAGGEQGFTLAEFKHDLMGPEPVRGVANETGVKFNGSGRPTDIGCRRAAQYMVLPRSPGRSRDMPALWEAVQKIARAPNATDAVWDELLDPYWTYANCQQDSGSWPRVDRERTFGINRLAESAEYRGHEVTLVVVDGEASLLTPKGALADSRALWEKEGPKNNFKVLHLTLADLKDSAKAIGELRTKVKDATKNGGASDKAQALIFWAEGIAGNVVLEALAGDLDEVKAIRNMTAAVVTVGSPLGGMLTSQLADAGVRGSIESAKRMLGDLPGAGALDVLAKVLDPVTDLAPGKRKAYMLNEFKNLDFSVQRAQAKKPLADFIYVMHLASVVDLADLTPMPLVTVRDNALALKADMNTLGHAAVMAHLPLFMNYPLSDGAVALQHAVIPDVAKPQHLETELLALLRLDHYSLALTRKHDSEEPQVPYVEIVDTIMYYVESKVF